MKGDNNRMIYEDNEKRYVVDFSKNMDKLKQIQIAKQRGANISVTVEITKGKVISLLSDNFFNIN